VDVKSEKLNNHRHFDNQKKKIIFFLVYSLFTCKIIFQYIVQTCFFKFSKNVCQIYVDHNPLIDYFLISHSSIDNLVFHLCKPVFHFSTPVFHLSLYFIFYMLVFLFSKPVFHFLYACISFFEACIELNLPFYCDKPVLDTCICSWGLNNNTRGLLRMKFIHFEGQKTVDPQKAF
jgi:hypothetical protein